MNYKKRREQLLQQMEEGSILILHSGVEMHVSADEYAAFEANRNFFYLTGLRRDQMILMMDKTTAEPTVTLFIEAVDPTMERWYGRKVRKEEAQEIAQIERVQYIDSFESTLHRMLMREDIRSIYMDCYRHDINDLPDYNLVKANELKKNYPSICIHNVFPMIATMRMQKDNDEVARIREAIRMTDLGLQNVLTHLEPGMKEYQAQADFEYIIKREGADSVSFRTIAGSGMNGTMLHYETNRDTMKEDTLVLLDLGAKYQGYCADITRTYPVSGKFTDRQREVYEIVLEANQTVSKSAKAGMTLLELNAICKKVLAQGCIRLGLIQSEEEIGKYYMHGVSHHLGIDVHDVTAGTNQPLREGAVITNEPGLYIDEWEIGIRIEDDLLITNDGCEVLSKDIIRTVEEIEAYMQQHRA